eukprot:Phypoly_transcript_11730.p1 GENE.Phypoly_transcript_11730~~Phypoly_transcript_11730.p1  ORF type:complete len:339 (+),score=38.53 Phypoly_transcript_11730:81-1019(+)
MTNHSFMVNETIPRCPDHPPQLLNSLAYPTTTLIFVVYAVTTLVFATIIAFKYNSVKVFNKKIRTQNISNTLWIIYYISMGIRTCLNATMYGITANIKDAHTVHGMLFYASIIVGGITAFTLCLSLNHQRKYRSSAPPNPAAQATAKEADPMLPKMDVVKRLADPAEIIFFLLFAASLLLFFFASYYETQVLVLVFVGSYAAQRLPVFVLALVIVLHRNGNEGPTRQSKIYLFFASLFHFTNELPIFFWAQLLPAHCIIGGAISVIDILIMFNFIALILFFLFLRTEYLRNMEECIWTTVSQIQDTFDFRRF